MRHSGNDDDNLAEVRAILGRLQRISLKPSAGGAQISDNDAAPSQSWQQANPAKLERGEGALHAAYRNAPQRVKAAVLVVPLVALLAGVVIFVGGDRRPAPTVEPSPEGAVLQNAVPEGAQAPQQEAAKSAALQLASELMASGQVTAARRALLRAVQDDTADVAWALARSYDPNFLVTIPAADAGPDVSEATRWYRTWYEIAVKQGLVSDSIPLERIIRSMN
jgi:hypothetical protein